MDEKIIIYTDGGCEPNPGAGGWAAVLIFGDHEKELSGAQADTTNNRMEMTAAIRALNALTRPCNVTFVTDSEYLRKGITQWLENWKRNNWRRRGGPVKNQDLWMELDAALQPHKVAWQWVRGHTGDHYNERCDELASQAIRTIKYAGT